MDRSVHVLQQKALSWHISFMRTTSQSPCLRETLATVVKLAKRVFTCLIGLNAAYMENDRIKKV